MALPASAIHMAFRTLLLPFGTGRSVLSPPFPICFARAQQLTILSPFLKERLFGLSNPQGNHGESLKEAHFHLDNTPVGFPGIYVIWFLLANYVS